MASYAGWMSAELLENLDQILLSLRASLVVEEAWPAEWHLLEGWRAALRLLRHAVHKQRCAQVALLVRTGRLDDALDVTRRLFPRLQVKDVEKILSLVYVDARDLQVAVPFLDKLTYAGVYLILDGLYQQIALNGHTQQPQMLLLKLLMDKVVASGVQLSDHTYRRVQTDCDRILGRVCHGIAAKDYSLTLQIVETLGVQPLSINMGYIVKVRCLFYIIHPVIYQSSLLSNQDFEIDILVGTLFKIKLIV
jgi:hypothetical protein